MNTVDTTNALTELLHRGRAPLGPQVHVELGANTGPLGELSALLTSTNGFTVFNAGVQVFHVGVTGMGPELGAWNAPPTWKDTYRGLADGLLCFAQDLFGTQFAIQDNRQVVAFNPETAELASIGESLHAWAQWLLDEPNVHGTHSMATAWQHTHGPLPHHQRLIPWRMFVLGGSYEDDNLVAKDAVTCMRIRGPIAQHLHNAPNGSRIRLDGQASLPEV